MHLQNQVDLSFHIQNQSIELLEIHSPFDDPYKTVEQYEEEKKQSEQHTSATNQ